MGRRRRKQNPKGIEVLFGIAVVIVMLTSQNPALLSSLNSLFWLVIKVLALGFFCYGIYWLVTSNKRNALHVKPKNHVDRKSIPDNESNNYISSVDIDTYRSYREAPEERKPESWSEELIKKLDWKSFEELCAEYFKEKGYESKVTREGADGGIDIHLFKDSYSPTKAFGIVQCKAWNAYNVGVKPIRELYGVKTAEEAPLGIFITSGSYTKEAKEFSKGKHLKLISGVLLLELILSLPEQKQQRMLKKITTGDYTTPSCASCGIKMTKRKSKKGKNIGNEFWGCVNYPKCRNTLTIKKA